MKIHPSLYHKVCRSWNEQTIHPNKLIYPIFVSDKQETVEIQGFDFVKRWGKGSNGDYDELINYLKKLVDKGLSAVMLFGVVDSTRKDARGTEANSETNPIMICGKFLRKEFPSLLLCFDVCLCEYTNHGHCGLVQSLDDGEIIIDNDSTVQRLTEVSLSYCKVGAHVICPSDMMDGRIASIREHLNCNGYSHVAIMAYTSKKASCLYSPFRNAVESTFKGSRSQYQHPVSSTKISERAYFRDIEEGADFVIVKPSLFYGDIIKSYAKGNVPVVAFVVSGEYKMLIDYGKASNSMKEILEESHLGLLRAGASVIITYFTPQLLDLLC